MKALVVLVAALLALPAGAADVVAKLSQTRVAISTSFAGSELFVYGAIRRSAETAGEPLDIIVSVMGPSEPVMVRRKERRLGVWINGPGVQVDAAPSLYAVATTGPFYDIISHTEDLIHHVGLDQAVMLIGSPQYEEYPEDHREALIRLRHRQGLYFRKIGGVNVTDGTLFDVSLALPGQIVEGDYRARVLLLDDKEVIDTFEDTVYVRRIGIERLVHTLAHEQPALYGSISILLALTAGWLASALFRLFLP